jgi:hypothetical protein
VPQHWLGKNAIRLDNRIACQTNESSVVICCGSPPEQWVSVRWKLEQSTTSFPRPIASICKSTCGIVSSAHLTPLLWIAVWRYKRRREYCQTFSQHIQQAPIRIITSCLAAPQVWPPECYLQRTSRITADGSESSHEI